MYNWYIEKNQPSTEQFEIANKINFAFNAIKSDEVKQLRETITVPEGLISEGEVLTVGLVGYSSLKEDQKEEALNYIAAALLEIDLKYKKQEKQLISGLTDYGVPSLGYSVVSAINSQNKDESWQLVGIAPDEVTRTLKKFPVDKTYLSGNLWGEDSAKFISSVKHVIIQVGGGNQARHEVSKLEEKGIFALKHELPIKKELLSNWDSKEDSIF